MISVEHALEELFALAPVMGIEDVPLAQAAGRVLAAPLAARRTQPPFAASAMDGYAVRADEVRPGARFQVIGEAAAGARFDRPVGSGQAVRIFTGAPVPEGASRVVIQEDVLADAGSITLKDDLDTATYIRPAGDDFGPGTELTAPRRLTPGDIALLAAMNHPVVPVRRRPVVALIATGNELVMPGEDPGPDQIIASNSFGLKAQLEAAGAQARLLPIARDTAASLLQAFELAKDADLVVTIGGASVGDHDLVATTVEELGMERAFYKVAMRPGKPLMAGRLRNAVMIGLPGNPVSAMVCGEVFLKPLIAAMLGLPRAPAPRLTAELASDLPANGPRAHYMRATVSGGLITAHARQDSALLGVLSQANALLVRPVGDGPQRKGTKVDYIPL